ncbi:MAG TPA: ribosomal protein S18-alanine N-acetyltransferase [Candidatus Sulfotelmatobacter sp.]
MRIRSANLADISSVIRLERESATAGHWTQEQYEQAFTPDRPKRLVLAAEEALSTPARSVAHAAPHTSQGSDVLLVGFLVARHVAPEWELENIVVNPLARRKGIGNRLLDALLAAAQQTNSNAVFLEVRESNLAARSFYETAGFEQTGRRKLYYANPAEDAMLYRRKIG